MADDSQFRIDVLQRMVDAVEQVRQRLVKACNALARAGVPYAVAGGNAVAAWVATIDTAAVRNTQDVDVLIRRSDFDAVLRAMESAGFVHRKAAGIDLFLDHAGAGPRDAVHIIYAGEVVRAGEPAPKPEISEAIDLAGVRFLSLEALVRTKLTAFRRQDQVHLLDLLGVGLIDVTWPSRSARFLARGFRNSSTIRTCKSQSRAAAHPRIGAALAAQGAGPASVLPPSARQSVLRLRRPPARTSTSAPCKSSQVPLELRGWLDSRSGSRFPPLGL